MAFKDCAKLNALFIASHVLGESIQYVQGSAAPPLTVSAKVNRRIVDVVGNVLQNAVDVFVSKTSIGAVEVGKDTVRLTADQIAGQPVPTYRVASVLTDGLGYWNLRCVR